MPEITWADLSRLSLEVSEGDKIAWLDARQISHEAIVAFCDYAKDAIQHISADPELGPSLALDGAISFAFQVGFEACEQFASRAENSQASPD